MLKKLQFITLLTAILRCFTHRKQQKIMKVILLRARYQNVNVLLSNITFMIFTIFDVCISSHCRHNMPQIFWSYDLDLSGSRDVISHMTIRFAICHFVLVVLWYLSRAGPGAL